MVQVSAKRAGLDPGGFLIAGGLIAIGLGTLLTARRRRRPASQFD
jgi:LPXTG-motif cell wall-anchored protein